MKKHLFIILLVCIKQVNAQAPIITSAYLPQVGSSYNNIADYTTADMVNFTVTAGSPSAQSWNYSTQFITTYTSNNTYYTPPSYPGPGSSNLATNNNWGAWDWYTSNSNGFFCDGSNHGNGNGVYYRYSPAQVILPTPFTYSDYIVTTYSFTSSCGGSGPPCFYRDHSIRTITADAFGSLTTPAGTFTNTLRIKTFEINIDSTWVDPSGTGYIFAGIRKDSSVSYMWIENSQNLFLMEIDMIGAETQVTNASYLQSFTNDIKANIIPFTSISIFPNPASDQFFIDANTTDKLIVDLFDVNGRHVFSKIASDKSTISVTNLDEGIYTLTIKTTDRVTNKKLVILR